MMFRSCLVGFLLATLLFGSCTAIQTRFQLNNANISKLVIFGDDYSDMGNVYAMTQSTFPNPLEYDNYVGPVCNGPVWWVQMNEQFLDSGLTYGNTDEVISYAYIGAGLNNQSRPEASHIPNTQVVVPGLVQQVEMYWAENALTTPDGTLFISFIGTNEFLTGASAAEMSSPEFFQMLITDYVTAIATNQGTCMAYSAAVVAQGGAAFQCNFLVVGLLQIGGSPYLYNLVGNSTDDLNSLINVFNANLRATILSIKYDSTSQLYAAYNQYFTNVQWVDPTAEYARMSGKPGQYGFLVDGGPLQGHENAFCAALGSTTHCKNVDDYYWWNPVWLSSNAHHWFGNKVFNEAFIQGEEKFYGYF